jgi:hypothetical protein
MTSVPKKINECSKKLLSLNKNFIDLHSGLLHKVWSSHNAHKFRLINVFTAYCYEAARDRVHFLHNSHHTLIIDQHSTQGLPMYATVLS